MKTIKFTNSEAIALLHRLSCWDCFEDVFRDTDGLEHLADGAWDCVKSFHDQLAKTRTITVDENSEMHREVMVEAIEGNTWVAVNDPDNDTNNSAQRHRAAYTTLCRCADKISLAFDILVSDIDVPQA